MGHCEVRYWCGHSTSNVSMKVSIVCVILIISSFSQINNAKVVRQSLDNCRQWWENLNTTGRQFITMIKNVNSYQDCNSLCQQVGGCRFWTWNKHSAGAYARNCVLMSGYAGTVVDGNAVSGGLC